MKLRLFYFIGLLLPLLLLMALPVWAHARAVQPAATVELSWHVIGGGGAVSSASGNYALSGTSGQSMAGSVNSGSYNLNAGFWFSGTGESKVYLPLVLK